MCFLAEGLKEGQRTLGSRGVMDAMSGPVGVDMYIREKGREEHLGEEKRGEFGTTEASGRWDVRKERVREVVLTEKLRKREEGLHK